MTRGILNCDVSHIFHGNIVSVDQFKDEFFYSDDFFFNESEAIKDAEQRKEKKLIQLQNQLAKLENKNVTIIKEV